MLIWPLYCLWKSTSKLQHWNFGTFASIWDAVIFFYAQKRSKKYKKRYASLTRYTFWSLEHNFHYYAAFAIFSCWGKRQGNARCAMHRLSSRRKIAAAAIDIGIIRFDSTLIHIDRLWFFTRKGEQHRAAGHIFFFSEKKWITGPWGLPGRNIKKKKERLKWVLTAAASMLLDHPDCFFFFFSKVEVDFPEKKKFTAILIMR